MDKRTKLKNQKFVIISLVAILAMITSCFTILTSINQGTVFAQQNNNASKSTTTTKIPQVPQVNSRQNATISGTVIQPSNKTFYVFTAEVADLNETKLGIKADVFTLPIMEVNKGDYVTVHFYNLEKVGGDRHSFTIQQPYNIDKDLAPGENGIISFKADHEGIFQYYCKYHEPAMTGQLVVRP
jgi:nitrous oxide reductase